MVSLDALLALVGPPGETEEPKGKRRRHDWVRGEVQCTHVRTPAWAFGRAIRKERRRMPRRLLGTDHHRQAADRSPNARPQPGSRWSRGRVERAH
jgi:hypothetical protein